MWKQLKISQQTYFSYCNFNTRTQDVTFVLYDLTQAWSQSSTFQEVKLKVKFLNRRFDFNDDNITEALSSSVIQSAVIEEHPNICEGLILKVKYRFKNCLLNYEWSLSKQNFIEFQKTFVQPLLLALFDCHQQVENLKSSIRKKDMELKQFRIEGAALNRKTLVTKPFDLEDFNNNYEDCNKTIISFMDLAKYLKENNRKAESERTNKQIIMQTKEHREPDENSNDDRNTNTRMSPGHKKRKLNDLKMQRFEQHLKFLKKGLEYESSQSQTSSSENCKTMEGVEVEKQKNYENNNVSLPRRSSRLKKPGNKSSDDKTDSDIEDHNKTFTKKITGDLCDVIEESSEISTKEKVTPNSKHRSNENPDDKCEKPNPSCSSRRKSLDSVCVFDFTTDIDDIDVLLLNGRRLEKSKNQHGAVLLEENKLLAKKGSILSFKDDCGNMRTADFIGEGRIIGGVELSIYEAKYQISLRVKETEKLVGFGKGHICGGSVIGQRLILTATHCVQSYAAKELTVVMGNANRILADPLQLQYNVKEIIKHPAFNSRDNTNDIALLFINGHIPWNWPTVQAIHLNTRAIAIHTPCKISGWGEKREGQQPMSLLAANVPIISYEQCRSTYIHIPNSMICAGYFNSGGVDACQGDSGGPLVCNGLLAGIISWGDGCAVAHKPGVYTNVSTFYDWIVKANSSLNYTSHDSAASIRLNVCLSILIVLISCMKIIH